MHHTAVKKKPQALWVWGFFVGVVFTGHLRWLQEISLHGTLAPSLPIQRPGLVTRELSATAPPYALQAFFFARNLRYGGCAWDVFGRAGFLDSRFTNLRTAATYSLGNEKVAALRQGARPCALQNRPKFSLSLSAIPNRTLNASLLMEMAND
ncbi:MULTISPECIES: hypothetical protein [Pseudomonas]|uniref:hypothetical protein n=1 Tax=Pseudomonas TaxID=286 RepID=UPI0011B01A35|nr:MULTISPECIES: hypothetical protein [Pseudomonas]QXN50515.1 hypothetical protein KW062_01680 [Pseudomonas fluorescens]WSO24829.1 hypothetical protein VUJ50_01690 [Pseudomonas fluorescens]